MVCTDFFNFAQWFLVIVLVSYVAKVSQSSLLKSATMALVMAWSFAFLFTFSDIAESMIGGLIRGRMTEGSYRLFWILFTIVAAALYLIIGTPHIIAIIDAFTRAQYTK